MFIFGLFRTNTQEIKSNNSQIVVQSKIQYQSCFGYILYLYIILRFPWNILHVKFCLVYKYVKYLSFKPYDIIVHENALKLQSSKFKIFCLCFCEQIFVKYKLCYLYRSRKVPYIEPKLLLLQKRKTTNLHIYRATSLIDPTYGKRVWQRNLQHKIYT